MEDRELISIIEAEIYLKESEIILNEAYLELFDELKNIILNSKENN